MRVFCVNTEKKIKHNNTKSQWPAHALNRHTHPLWTGNNFWPSVGCLQVDNLSHTVPHSGAHCASARLKCIKNSLDICIYIIYIRIYIRCIFIYIHPLKGTWPGKELRHSGLKNKNKLQRQEKTKHLIYAAWSECAASASGTDKTPHSADKASSNWHKFFALMPHATWPHGCMDACWSLVTFSCRARSWAN